MASLQETLSKKFGPLPIYGWVGIGGGVLALLYIRGQSSAGQSGQTGQDGQAQQPGYAPSPIVVTPGTAALPPPPTSSPATAPTPVWQFGPTPTQGTYIWQVTDQGAQTSGGILPRGPQPGPLTQDILQRTGPYGTQWATVPSGYTPTSWIQALITGGMGGGGFGGAVKTIGRVGRFNTPHVKKQFLQLSPMGMGGAPNLQPQYGPGFRGPSASWYGMGGGGAIHHVSRRTGIPEERLAAMNPGLWRPGVIRGQRHMVIG